MRSWSHQSKLLEVVLRMLRDFLCSWIVLKYRWCIALIIIKVYIWHATKLYCLAMTRDPLRLSDKPCKCCHKIMSLWSSSCKRQGISVLVMLILRLLAKPLFWVSMLKHQDLLRLMQITKVLRFDYTELSMISLMIWEMQWKDC